MKIAAGVITSVLVLAIAGTFVANAYAKSKICDALESISKPSSSSPSSSQAAEKPDGPTPAMIRATADDMRTAAKLLVVDGDLKGAVNGLASDADKVASMVDADSPPGWEQLPQLFAIVSSIDVHVRDAQSACDQKETGIM